MVLSAMQSGDVGQGPRNIFIFYSSFVATQVPGSKVIGSGFNLLFPVDSATGSVTEGKD